MSGVARIHQKAGWTVTGSDEGFYPPVSNLITRYRIACATPYAVENIPSGVNRIVIGRHAKLTPAECSEVAEAYRLQAENGVEVLSFPEALATFLKDTHNIVVAGSFGKSSCTAMCAHVLRIVGKDPSWFVGADSIDLKENGHLDESNLFVLEGDEYPAKLGELTPKFAFYNAKTVLLTSCEHDHFNVYPTVGDYLQPFRQLLAELPSDGGLFCCTTGANIERIIQQTRLVPIWYGVKRDERTTWWAEDIHCSDAGMRFRVMKDDVLQCECELQVIGNHMVENAIGIIAMLATRGIAEPKAVAHALYAFRGVKRRLERISRLGHTPIFNDFGSSQAKLQAGINAIRSAYPSRRLTVIFEPHTFSFRNRAALDWYSDLFREAHRVIVLPPPTHGAATHDQLTWEEITKAIERPNLETVPLDKWAGLRREIAVWSDRKQDVILLESSGDFYGMWPELEAWAANK